MTGACMRFNMHYDWPSARALFSQNTHGPITNYAELKQAVIQNCLKIVVAKDDE